MPAPLLKCKMLFHRRFQIVVSRDIGPRGQAVASDHIVCRDLWAASAVVEFKITFDSAAGNVFVHFTSGDGFVRYDLVADRLLRSARIGTPRRYRANQKKNCEANLWHSARILSPIQLSGQRLISTFL